jgi:hypothetical protein
MGAVAELCTSCTLTRARPNDADTAGLAAFAAAETAKRRLVAELIDLKLPIVSRDEDPQCGLAFDLLSSELEKVVTSHHNGVITLNLAAGDDVHCARLGIAMDEPYRTLLGHLRHEIGHYYFYRLHRELHSLEAILERLAADETARNDAIAGAGTARRLPLQVIATRGAHDSALRKADPRTES